MGASDLATTITPDVSLSSRWTMPGRASPPMPDSSSPAWASSGIDQRAVEVARGRVDDQSGRLVEHDEVAVLVQDRQRDGLRRRRRGDGCGTRTT